MNGNRSSGVLGRLNDQLTAFSAIVGTLGAIAAGLAALFANFAKDEAQDANQHALVATTSANGAKDSADKANDQAIRAREKAEAAEQAIREAQADIQKLKVRELTEDTSYRFATEFMERLEGLKSAEKEPQMITSALEIIAQASGDKDGKSSAALRAALPIKLALLRGDAGSVATMDSSLQHADIWLQLARFDDDDLPRTTAIRALCMISRVAAGRGDTQLATKCVVHADELRRLLEEERLRRMQERDDRGRRIEETSKAERTIATQRRERARQARLEAFAQMMMLRNYLADDLGWKEPPESAASPPTELADSPEHAMRLLKLVLVDLFESERQLAVETKNPSTLTASKSPAPAQTADTKTQTTPPPVHEVPVQQALALVNALRAKEETRQAAQAPTENEEKARIDVLIEQLKEPLADRRRAARASLALIGNPAVEKLLAAVTGDVDPDPERKYKLRLGVATALSLMKQPIYVKAGGAPALKILIQSNDRETRVAAADFIMDLWDGESVRGIFAELARLFENLPDPGKDRDQARAVYNTALIVATWARTLSDSIKPPPGSTAQTMRVHALQTAIEWQKKLVQSPHRAQWGDTLGILNSLIPRAQLATPRR